MGVVAKRASTEDRSRATRPGDQGSLGSNPLSVKCARNCFNFLPKASVFYGRATFLGKSTISTEGLARFLEKDESFLRKIFHFCTETCDLYGTALNFLLRSGDPSGPPKYCIS